MRGRNLVAAQTAGEIPFELDPEETARMLLAPFETSLSKPEALT